MNYIVGVDVGGTFTDCVAVDELGTVTLGKALSTPDDFAVGALDAVDDAAHNLGLASDAELLTATSFFFHWVAFPARATCKNAIENATSMRTFHNSLLLFVDLARTSATNGLSQLDDDLAF